MLSFSKIVLLAVVIGGVIMISRFLKRRDEAARDRVDAGQRRAAKGADPAQQVNNDPGGDKDVVHLDACPFCGAYADLRLHKCDQKPGPGPV